MSPSLPMQEVSLRLRRGIRSQLGLLPSFLVIGAQESGTSSLYRNLVHHPSVAAAELEEIHYFDQAFGRSVSWYRARFPSSLGRQWISPRTALSIVTGEATAYYLFHPHVPSRVRTILPWVRLVVLLRNPVDRALHHYELNRIHGRESGTLAEALAREAREFPKALERLLQAPDRIERTHRHFSYLAQGVYVDQLLAWEQHFPASQLLVLSTEEFFAAPVATLERVADFLGLPGWGFPPFEDHDAREHEPLDGTVREHLIRHFERHNERLYEHLDRSFEWDR